MRKLVKTLVYLIQENPDDGNKDVKLTIELYSPVEDPIRANVVCFDNKRAFTQFIANCSVKKGNL
ncbi:MAG: hypothetical protein WAU17_01915 [Nitrospirales bacterium]